MEILKLRAERKKLLDEAREVQAREDFSGTDKDQFEKIMTEFDALTAKVTRMESLEKADAKLEAENVVKEKVVFDINRGQVDKNTILVSDEYKNAFWNIVRGNNLPEFKNILSTGGGSGEGFTIPTELDRVIKESLMEMNVMRQLCSVMQTSNDREMVLAADHGLAAWTAELANYAPSDPSFVQKTLGAFKATREVRVSEELLMDTGVNLVEYLGRAIGYSFGTLEEAAYIDGTGAGQPLGILGDPGLQTFGLAGAAAITAAELIDLQHGIIKPYRDRAVWLMNDDTHKAIRKLVDGNGAFLLVPGLASGAPDTLLGRPVHTSPGMPVMATTANSIVFGDFSKITIGDRSTRTLRRLNEIYATTGEVAFISMERTDIVTVDNAALVASLHA